MCGLYGFLGFDSEIKQMPLTDIQTMLKHRGPDGSGTYVGRLCTLVHARLAILDLTENGKQPYLEKSTALAFNGQIYNHLSLRERYLSEEKFSSHCDTETLAKLLVRYGRKTFTFLNGMFAGAFWDEKNSTLILFRDPLGIKPMYYRIEDNRIEFASEIKVLQAKGSTAKVKRDTLNSYLVFENYPQSNTMFEGIQSLKPGDILIAQISEEKIKYNIETFIFDAKSALPKEHPYFESPALNDDDLLVKQVRNILETSVRDHLMSDVPLGVYMSGGIDSTSVAAIARKFQPDLEAFTGFFETSDSFYDESGLAKDAAKKIGIPINCIAIKPKHFTESFDQLTYHLDEPRMGMGSFSQFIVAKEVAKHRKVILAGHGGDELFCGYPMFKVFHLLLDKKVDTSKLAKLKSFSSKDLVWLLDQVRRKILTSQYHFAPQIFKESKFPTTLAASFRSMGNSSTIEELQRYYQDVYLPGLLLVEDTISMANSLETRVPIWSMPVINWIRKIPPMRHFSKAGTKALMKKAVADLLPDNILSAPKRGFPTPLRIWFRKDLYRFVQERLLDGTDQIHCIVSRRNIEKILKSHRDQKLPFALDEQRAHKIWMLLCLESWARQYKVNLC